MMHNNILDTIGNTPLVELKRYSPKKRVRIFAKLEGFNPGGSIKDRIAFFMIKKALKKRLLTKDKTIIEATSGNTGIGLAMIAAILGFNFKAVMPDSVSIERIKLLKAYGAKLKLTDGVKGTDWSYEYAKDLAKENPNKYIMLDQFKNEANAQAHFETTGIEILADMPDISHFVVGMGTGGTVMGVGRRLKEANSSIQIIGIEPKKKSKIQGLRNMNGFIPKIFKPKFLDLHMQMVSDKPAFELARDLFRTQGLSVGISSGAALWGAMETAKKMEKGRVVTVFPDRGDKYFSTSLFD